MHPRRRRSSDKVRAMNSDLNSYRSGKGQQFIFESTGKQNEYYIRVSVGEGR